MKIVPLLTIFLSLTHSSVCLANDKDLRRVQIDELESTRLPDIEVSNASLSDVISILQKDIPNTPEKQGFNYSVALGPTIKIESYRISLNLRNPTLGMTLSEIVAQTDLMMDYDAKDRMIRLSQDDPEISDYSHKVKHNTAEQGAAANP